MSEPGHNSGEAGDIGADRLRSIVERFERLDAEVADLRSDQKDILQEATSAGFDKRVLRQLIRLRKQEPAEVEEQEQLLAVYRKALA